MSNGTSTHWMVSAIELPATLILTMTGAHLTLWPLVNMVKCSLLRSHLAETNLLLSGLIVFTLVLPLSVCIEICLLLQVNIQHQCTLQRFFQRLAESQHFLSLPWIAAERLKRMWVFGEQSWLSSPMWSQGLELVSWLLLLPLMGFMVYASQEERFMDIELQVCMRQEKVSAQTSLIQTLQRWWFPGGAIITFCLSCCIYAATIVHLHRRLKRIGQAPIASELSRTNSVRHDKTMRENILSVPSEMMRKRRLLKHQPEFLSLEDLTSDSMWNERDVRHKSSRRLMLKRHSQNKYSLANHSLDSLPSTASAPSVLGGTGDSNTPRFPVSERRRSSSEVGTSVQSEESQADALTPTRALFTDRWRMRMASCPQAALDTSLTSFCKTYYDNQHSLNWMNLQCRKQLPPLENQQKQVQTQEASTQINASDHQRLSGLSAQSEHPTTPQDIPKVKIIRPSMDTSKGPWPGKQKTLGSIQETPTLSQVERPLDTLSISSRTERLRGKVHFLRKAMKRTALLQGTFLACLFFPVATDLLAPLIPFHMLINIHPIIKLTEFACFTANPILFIHNYKPLTGLHRIK